MSVFTGSSFLLVHFPEMPRAFLNLLDSYVTTFCSFCSNRGRKMMDINRGPTGGLSTLSTDREAENVFLLGNKLAFYTRRSANITLEVTFTCVN